MNETIKDIVVGILEKGAGALLGLGIACGLILFLPAYWPSNVSLAAIAKTYEEYLTIGMIGGLTVGCCMWSGWKGILEAILGIVALPFLKRKIKANVLRAIPTLSDEEWLVLACCINKNVTTVRLPAVHPLTQALMGKGFLTPSTSTGDVLWFSFEIPPLAWRVMTTHASFSADARKVNAAYIESMAYRLSDRHHW